MTTPIRKQFERRAGLRFAHLIRQLLDDGWKSHEIAAAIGADRSLVTKWSRKRGDTTSSYDLLRNGITDQTIQGIHDGLRVRSDYLFMSPKGLPQTVRLKNGQERPCEEGELDHKLFLLEEAREKRDVVDLKRRADVADAKLDALTKAFEQLAAAVSASLLPAADSKRNTR